ncbi:uncharacterized protein PAC_15179 [Phialocephala subalpina]|uniref:C2H2-type domain-containing protein n=1 Tax=Phialocephala subalpina TaxID=576137 RepID=A0A1L7XJR2_9HELO|nr:uncharacterized protein PAC_15179 [Phialocephala subalpina]
MLGRLRSAGKTQHNQSQSRVVDAESSESEEDFYVPGEGPDSENESDEDFYVPGEGPESENDENLGAADNTIELDSIVDDFAKDNSTANVGYHESHICFVPKCTQTFKRRVMLLRHLPTHLPDPIFRCKSCPLSFETSVGCIKHCKKTSHSAPDTCVTCDYEYSEVDEYVQHYLTDHSNIGRYICTHCQNISISEEDVEAHVCQRQLETNQELKKLELPELPYSLEVSQNYSQEYKISLALKALPESPTRDVIAQWILDHVPPASKYKSNCRELTFRTLPKKFHQTENGGWKDIETDKHKLRTRIPIDRLIAIAFYKASFAPLSAHGIYESSKEIYRDPSLSKAKFVATITAHLKRKNDRYIIVGETVEQMTKTRYIPKAKELWSVIQDQQKTVTLLASSILNQETNNDDPGIPFPDLVRLARANGQKTYDDIYEWITAKYPIHVGARKKIRDAAGRIRVGISRKRPQLSALSSPNEESPTSFLSAYAPDLSTVRRSDTLSSSPCTNYNRLGRAETDDSETHDPKKGDPDLVNNGVGDPIQSRDQEKQAKEMHKRLILLHRASFYYGNEGDGLDEIRNEMVSHSFLNELLYSLHVEEKQARERVHMGDGWMLMAHFAGVILAKIHELLFTEALIQPSPLFESAMSFEEVDAENVNALFPSEAGCFSCLTGHDQSETCRPVANSPPAYPSPRQKYRYYDLLLLLWVENGSVAQPVVHRWLKHHRSASDSEILDCIRRFCEAVGRNEKGDNLLKLRARFKDFPDLSRTDTTFEDPASATDRIEAPYIPATVPSGPPLILSPAGLLEDHVPLQISVPTATHHSRNLTQSSISNPRPRSASCPDIYGDLPQAQNDAPIEDAYDDLPQAQDDTLAENPDLVPKDELRQPRKVPVWIVTNEPSRVETHWRDGHIRGTSLATFIRQLSKETQGPEIEEIKLELKIPKLTTRYSVRKDEEDEWAKVKRIFAEQLKSIKGTIKSAGSNLDMKILVEPVYRGSLLEAGFNHGEDYTF